MIIKISGHCRKLPDKKFESIVRKDEIDIIIERTLLEKLNFKTFSITYDFEAIEKYNQEEDSESIPYFKEIIVRGIFPIEEIIPNFIDSKLLAEEIKNNQFIKEEQIEPEIEINIKPSSKNSKLIKLEQYHKNYNKNSPKINFKTRKRTIKK